MRDENEVRNFLHHGLVPIYDILTKTTPVLSFDKNVILRKGVRTKTGEDLYDTVFNLRVRLFPRLSRTLGALRKSVAYDRDLS